MRQAQLNHTPHHDERTFDCKCAERILIESRPPSQASDVLVRVVAQVASGAYLSSFAATNRESKHGKDRQLEVLSVRTHVRDGRPFGAAPKHDARCSEGEEGSSKGRREDRRGSASWTGRVCRGTPTPRTGAGNRRRRWPVARVQGQSGGPARAGRFAACCGERGPLCAGSNRHCRTSDGTAPNARCPRSIAPGFHRARAPGSTRPDGSEGRHGCHSEGRLQVSRQDAGAHCRQVAGHHAARRQGRPRAVPAARVGLEPVRVRLDIAVRPSPIRKVGWQRPNCFSAAVRR